MPFQRRNKSDSKSDFLEVEFEIAQNLGFLPVLVQLLRD